MRLAYCLPSLYYPSGMERVLTLKANYFADVFGYEVYIILTDGKDKQPYYDLSPKVKVINLDINYDHLYGTSAIKKVPSYIFKQLIFRRRLRRTLRDIRPDITISMLRREINFINSIDDGSVKIGEIHFDRKNYRSFNSEGLFGAVRRVASRLWMRQLLHEIGRLSRFVVLTHEDRGYWSEVDNVEVIHNPLSFNPSHQSDCTSHRVIAVGRYMPQKGFDRLIDAWAKVAAKHPDWSLRIYGDGRRDELQAQINSLGIGDSCLLEHSVRDIESKYCESSIFVLSSRFEGFGMVIVEAMACGLPVVSFACPCGPRDIIEQGKTGFLVENGDIDGLADNICRLIEDEELRRTLGAQAKGSVDRFDMDKIANKWRELFEEVLKK